MSTLYEIGEYNPQEFGRQINGILASRDEQYFLHDRSLPNVMEHFGKSPEAATEHANNYRAQHVRGELEHYGITSALGNLAGIATIDYYPQLSRLRLVPSKAFWPSYETCSSAGAMVSAWISKDHSNEVSGIYQQLRDMVHARIRRGHTANTGPAWTTENTLTPVDIMKGLKDAGFKPVTTGRFATGVPLPRHRIPPKKTLYVEHRA